MCGGASVSMYMCLHVWKLEIFPSITPYLISETSLTKSEAHQFHKTDWSASLWGSPDSASPWAEITGMHGHTQLFIANLGI